MGVRWLIAFLYFILDWFIPGVGLPRNLFALKQFVVPLFLILVIILFGKTLIDEFKKLKWKEILLVVAVAMVLFILNDQLFSVSGSTDVKINDLWIYLLSAVTYGPFFEEMIFRYCIIPLSGSKLSRVITLLISAAFFSMAHGFSLTHFMSGLIFGVVYLLKKNIWYPIIVHYINNLIAVGIILIYMV